MSRKPPTLVFLRQPSGGYYLHQLRRAVAVEAVGLRPGGYTSTTVRQGDTLSEAQVQQLSDQGLDVIIRGKEGKA